MGNGEWRRKEKEGGWGEEGGGRREGGREEDPPSPFSFSPSSRLPPKTQCPQPKDQRSPRSPQPTGTKTCIGIVLVHCALCAGPATIGAAHRTPPRGGLPPEAGRTIDLPLCPRGGSTEGTQSPHCQCQCTMRKRTTSLPLAPSVLPLSPPPSSSSIRLLLPPRPSAAHRICICICICIFPSAESSSSSSAFKRKIRYGMSASYHSVTLVPLCVALLSYATPVPHYPYHLPPTPQAPRP